MERYGFFFMSDAAADGEPGDLTYLHGTLYEHAHQCLRAARDWETSDEKIYFKMLNNSEIIKYANVKQNKKKIWISLFIDRFLKLHVICTYLFFKTV